MRKAERARKRAAEANKAKEQDEKEERAWFRAEKAAKKAQSGKGVAKKRAGDGGCQEEGW